MNEAWSIFWFDTFKTIFIVATVAFILHRLNVKQHNRLVTHLQNHHRTMEQKIDLIKKHTVLTNKK
jgi:UDP-N-acetylmuramyl pentapeptide phosphotransferase/UDP-N-acetylglucosamine-1-phosphate transferase